MPKLSIEQIQAFGQKFSNLQVLAHTIPLGSQVHGILGMNFLRQFDFRLLFKQAVIEIS